MRWTSYVECKAEVRNLYRIVVEKSDGKRPPLILRPVLEYNIKFHIIGTEYISVEWI